MGTKQERLAAIAEEVNAMLHGMRSKFELETLKRDVRARLSSEGLTEEEFSTYFRQHFEN